MVRKYGRRDIILPALLPGCWNISEIAHLNLSLKGF